MEDGVYVAVPHNVHVILRVLFLGGAYDLRMHTTYKKGYMGCW